MAKSDYTPEEIKKTLMAMLDCKGRAMGVTRGTVQGALDYILLLERRQGDLLGKCVDPCALCRHNEEEQCNDDFCCTTCGSTACKCKTCGDTGVNSGFEWRDDL